MQRRTVLTSAAFLAAAAAGPLCAAVQESTQAFSALGSKPTGARLERIQASPNFSNGTFHNLTPVIDPIDRERSSGMIRFLTEDKTGRRPLERIPSIKTDLTTLADGQMVWFGHSGFYLKLAGLAIAVDPALHACFPLGSFFKPFAGADLYQPRDIPALDLLILTHDHYDHLDTAVVAMLSKPETRVICNAVSAAALGYGEVMANGDTLRLADDMLVEAVPAYNFTPGHENFHPAGGRDNGYLLTLGGTRVYIAGDSENTPEMMAMKDIDIAFLPVNQPYTMTVDQAVEAVKAIKPRIFYPYHYGQVEEKTDMDRLVEEVKDITEVRVRPME